ncbi:hypothetical protein [Candidatus Rhodobacter oscarellae]|uniref:hypothetical protein n=1 Tax=Candidatus Rhodobacter oscarellae TaxID=1675527 RepID=UPI001364B88A|nr:hypothetical protein [Candidatus Rhodobacter lobularis]
MTQFETPEIKRHLNGSIDTGYYIKIGRKARADEMRALAKRAIPKAKRAMPKPRIFSLPFWMRRAAAT